MRIHENIELVLLSYPEDLDRELDPLLVIDAGTSMFNGLPGENVSNCVVTPLAQSLKMDMRVLD